METFHWDQHFETGLETVDGQHRELVALINQFSTLVEEAAELDSPDLERVYGDLTEYARKHFEGERDLMQGLGVDARHQKRHLLAHGTFLTDIKRIRQEAGERFSAGARPLLNFLTHWLAYHILGMDQAMARQIAAIRGGAAPADAFDAMPPEPDAARSPLLRSLSNLFEVVSERNRQLLEMNQSLESKVSERTHALSESNEELLKIIEQLRLQQEQSLRLSQELATANMQLETMAMTDALTGLFNRRFAMDRLSSELATVKRYGEPLSVVLLDADGFKIVNDTHGHDAGDAVIRALGTHLKELFRANDVVCRMGGDEFLVICPRTTSQAAYQVAERARSSISGLRVPAGRGEWKGSVSVGVASIDQRLVEAEALIKAADLAVYEAKHMGRNRVVTYEASGG